jgi:hypothetical protein
MSCSRRAGAYYLKSGMLTQLQDDGIDLIVDFFRRMPSGYLVFFDHCGGACRHMKPDAAAFPNREMLFTLGARSVWSTHDHIEENTQMMRANWKELAPLTAGFYTNSARTSNGLLPSRPSRIPGTSSG